MVKHKLDDLNEIKNNLYETFQGKEWFKGAGLCKIDKKNWCIMTLVKKENLNDIPDVWNGVEVKKTIII